MYKALKYGSKYSTSVKSDEENLLISSDKAEYDWTWTDVLRNIDESITLYTDHTELINGRT